MKRIRFVVSGALCFALLVGCGDGKKADSSGEKDTQQKSGASADGSLELAGYRIKPPEGLVASEGSPMPERMIKDVGGEKAISCQELRFRGASPDKTTISVRVFTYPSAQDVLDFEESERRGSGPGREAETIESGGLRFEKEGNYAFHAVDGKNRIEVRSLSRKRDGDADTLKKVVESIRTDDSAAKTPEKGANKTGPRIRLRPRRPERPPPVELTNQQQLAIDELKQHGSRGGWYERRGKVLFEVDFRGTEVGDEALVLLPRLTSAENSATVGSLKLDGTGVTDAGLKHLRGLSDLESLSLRGTQISNVGLSHLKNLTNLSFLHLEDTNVTDAGLDHLAGLKQLRDLILSETSVTEAAAQQLLDRLPKFPTTTITPFGHLKKTPTAEEQASQAFSGVGSVHKVPDKYGSSSIYAERVLGADRLGVRLRPSPQVAEKIKQFPQIRELQLLEVTDADLAHFSDLSQIEVLLIRSEKMFDGSGLAHLKTWSELQAFDLGYTPSFSDAGLQHLGTFPKLRFLDVGDSKVTDAGVAQLAGLTNLEALNLHDTQITDTGLIHLQNMSKLRELDLSSTGITDAGLSQISKMSILQVLSLGSTSITDAGVEHLTRLTMLCKLDLGLTNISDVGVAHLKQLANLEVLELNASDISDEGLKHLSEMSSLRELWVGSFDITDAGIAHLRKLTELRKLVFFNTKATEEGMRELRKALPNTEIE